MAKKQRLSVVSNDSKEIQEVCKGFSLHHLNSFKPMTYPQREFVRAFDQDIPIIAQVGSAGTGKTAMALHLALRDVFDKSTVWDKVILIRSAVQARNIGFLKGDEQEKDSVFEKGYVSLCDQLLKPRSNNYNNLKAKGYLEFHNTSFLRGQTFDNAIVILDECENCTFHELHTVLTRLGVNSRLVLCGDFQQCDLKGTRHDKSGLGKLVRVLDHMPSASYEQIVYRPEDVVRSGVVKDFLLAMEDSGESNDEQL